MDHGEAFGLSVGVGGSATVERGVSEETDEPAGGGVGFVLCSRAAQDPGAGAVRKGVAYVGPCFHPGRAVAFTGVTPAACGLSRCGG
jgi:hypothetical protein